MLPVEEEAREIAVAEPTFVLEPTSSPFSDRNIALSIADPASTSDFWERNRT
jgi:hypothetical protein